MHPFMVSFWLPSRFQLQFSHYNNSWLECESTIGIFWLQLNWTLQFLWVLTILMLHLLSILGKLHKILKVHSWKHWNCWSLPSFFEFMHMSRKYWGTSTRKYDWNKMAGVLMHCWSLSIALHDRSPSRNQNKCQSSV